MQGKPVIDQKRGLYLLLPINLKRMAVLIVLCIFMEGCALPNKYRSSARSNLPRKWAFFIDNSIEKQAFLRPGSVPSFVDHIKAILVAKYDYDEDNILVFKSLQQFFKRLHTSDLGRKLQNGGSVVVYFYSGKELDFSKIYFHFASPYIYRTTDAFYPAFIATANIERILGSSVFAIFEGCGGGFETAFGSRIQEFKGLFNQRGTIELLADCGFTQGPDQFRERLVRGLDGAAAEPSGMLTGERLVKWVYSAPIQPTAKKEVFQKVEIGESYFSSRPRSSSSQQRQSFEWIPSLSQLTEKMLTSDDVETQRSAASLIQRQLNPQTRSQSTRISAADLEGLWEIVGKDDRDFQGREFLMRALTEADEPNAVARLSEFITDKYKFDVRRAATGNLALIRKPEAIGLQTKQLYNPDLAIREVAFESLKTWSDAPETARELFGQAFSLLVENEDQPYKLRLVRTLVESATKQQTPGDVFNRNILGQKLLEVLEIGPPDLRREVIFALREIKYEQAAPKLIEIFFDTDDDEIVRTAAAYSIGKVTDELKKSDLRRIDELIGKEKKPSIQAGAIYLLARFHDDKSVETLIEASQDDRTTTVRLAAIDALSNIKNAEVENALISASEDPDKQVRLMAVNALGKQEPTKPVIERLSKITENESDNLTKELARKLLEKAGGNFAESIKTISNGKASVEDKINAVESLGALVKAGVVKDKDGLMEIRDAVFTLFSESDWNLRTAAILTLEEFPDLLIKQRVGESLENDYAVTRATAVRLVARKGYQEYLDTVLNMLSQQGEQITVRIEAARALANTELAEANEVRVIGRLVNVATEESDRVLQNAAVLSAIWLLAALEKNVAATEISQELLGLIDETIATSQQFLSYYGVDRTISFLVGGRYYGKRAKILDDNNQEEMLRTAARYYRLAIESIPQIQPASTSFEPGYLLQTIRYLFYADVNVEHIPLDQEARYAFQNANFPERVDIIRSAIWLELAELYGETSRPDKAVEIYDRLLTSLSLSNLRQSIVFTTVLVQFSQEMFKAEKFRKSADTASLALASIALPHQLQNELLFEEQAKLLELIDNLMGRGVSVIQERENQAHYKRVDDNLRRFCKAKKEQPEYCPRFKTNDTAN